ncbi:TetR/AcrR family transcriptional regulator [Bordetella hinzii]|uniref:TetR/AcrR family transcriptional regulator n=2 Tax=Bordetella hinzii TaxID=103855 RepID=A0AAN1VHJ7_9BORD|nr:TetR/AcrR family transcriptional regulator [Bordetella hinzii]AKQ55275.1 HTH-type transcriptional repressor KstR2 [Bordetella hinzii]AKQ59782.1 HTH-type transcriptional repressor KstR2 [Bordetella hinzii]AZW19094.1 TetR/AcrR family transcriptional regulator [Bordetella hinzii]KCB21509.1 transcriptional regulator, TetR family [Bordetella hinzii OH87 BAL007II]KCB28507.1 transcriptional regulator, TetR family [Bordetella hinzii CA90 BAL1384]
MKTTAQGAGEVRREAVIQTAGRMFREHGYERTTVRELASAVGLQSGSLFHHFRSKEEILLEVMSRGIEEVLEQGGQALRRYEAPGDRLAALFRVHLWSMLAGAGGDAMHALVYEWRSLSPQARAGVKALSDRYESMWQRVVEQAVGAGVLRGDARVIKRYLLGGLNLTVQWYRPRGRLSPAQFVQAMLQAALPELAQAGDWPPPA